MSPYNDPVYSNASDFIITWLLIGAWVGVWLIGTQGRLRDVAISEGYLLRTSRALSTLCLISGGSDLLALVFLVWLKISSDIWFFWDLVFFLGVVAVFWIMPVLVVGLFCWALVGKKRFAYSPRALKTAAQAMACLAFAALSYYAFACGLAANASK